MHLPVAAARSSSGRGKVKRNLGRAAELYCAVVCAVCGCEEEMLAKVRPDMVIEGRRRRGREMCRQALSPFCQCG